MAELSAPSIYRRAFEAIGTLNLSISPGDSTDEKQAE
jgi:hypothetical protein